MSRFAIGRTTAASRATDDQRPIRTGLERDVPLIVVVVGFVQRVTRAPVIMAVLARGRAGASTGAAAAAAVALAGVVIVDIGVGVSERVGAVRVAVVIAAAARD